MKAISTTLFAASAFLILAQSGPAHAGVEACGDIAIEASAECELVAPGLECEAECTPISVQAACAGSLSVECSGECNASATVNCNGTCSASCEGTCEANPGSFECGASCQGQCEGNCTASCEDSECMAQCQATCSGSCDAQCEGVPPSATCEGKCEASCEGSCEAEANFDCQISCQSEGFIECTTDIQGGCEVACETEEGALFCDGSYVDVGGNLDACVEALKNLFNIEVDGYASAECMGNSCEAEAGGSVGCAMSSAGGTTSGWALLGLAFLWSRRRRRR